MWRICWGVHAKFPANLKRSGRAFFFCTTHNPGCQLSVTSLRKRELSEAGHLGIYFNLLCFFSNSAMFCGCPEIPDN